MNPENIYPRTNDHETVYLKNVIKNPNILVGDFTMYNDFVYDPRQFEKNNVLYHIGAYRPQPATVAQGGVAYQPHYRPGSRLVWKRAG